MNVYMLPTSDDVMQKHTDKEIKMSIVMQVHVHLRFVRKTLIPLELC